MKSARRASAVVAPALATILITACSGQTSVPAGYHRIGDAGGDVLYGKVAHESDGDYADVLLRSEDGDTLCQARGPLMTNAAQGVAICDGGSDEVYVYVAQTSKTRSATRLCRQDGQPVAAQLVRTDETWPADFTVSVDRSGDQFPVVPCSALEAE